MSNEEEKWQDRPESTSNIGISIVLWCNKYLGRRCARMLIWFISIFVWIFNARFRKISSSYFKTLELYAEKKHIKLPKHSSFKHLNRFCINIFDQMISWQHQIPLNEINLIDHAYERFVEATTKQEQGKIILGAHIGNLEMLRAINQEIKLKNKLNIFLWTTNNKQFLKYIAQIDPHSSLNIIQSNSFNPATIYKLEDCIKNGETIIILADRITDPQSKTIKVNFLGKECLFPLGPWIIATLLDAPIYTNYNILVDGRYYCYFNEWGKINIKNRKTRNQELTAYVQKYAHELEELLFLAPNDWFNFYDFWHIDEEQTK